MATLNIYTKLKDVLYPEKEKNRALEEFPIDVGQPSKTKKKKGLNTGVTKNFKQNINKKYVTSFINVIKDNSNILPNYKECIEKIEKEFNIKEENINKDKQDLTRRKEFTERIIPTDRNFYEL